MSQPKKTPPKLPTEAVMRRAVANREIEFDGGFVYGVISTGVYCRPSCASRPAKPQNLRFFADPAAAEAAGLRPCKRCQPRALHDRTVQSMQALARFIESHAEGTLSLQQLAERAHLSPTHLQRTFKAVLGISPKAFHDAARLRLLKSGLRAGKRVLDSITAAGFQSTSRVYGHAARNLGMRLSAYRAGGEGETIAYAYRVTALGPLLMAATDRGVCFAQFGASEAELVNQLRGEFSKAQLVVSSMSGSPQLDAWIQAFEAHISGTAPRPELPLDIRGTAFQVRVWKFLLGVPEGAIVSYGEVAAGIGEPKAVRATASACAANRIAVLVPCHRVLRGDGGLGGYRWGLERKRTLLDAERARRAA